MASPTAPFRLMDLPTELREHILRFALTSGQPIAPRVSIPRDAFVLRLPPLTKVSHQLRQESLPLYFEANTFHFNVKDVLEPTLAQDLRFEKKLLTFGAWCQAAGPENFAKIREFHFQAGGGFRTINVVVRIGRFGSVSVDVRSVWLEAAGVGGKEAPELLMKLAREGVEKNGMGGSLFPDDVVAVCREIQGREVELWSLLEVVL